MLKTLQGDKDAVLVVGTETTLLVLLGRIAKDDTLVLDAYKIGGMQMLHLIHVSTQTSIALSFAFCDEEVAMRVLRDDGCGYVVLDVTLDETSHLFLSIAWREHTVKGLEKV